MLLSLVVVKRGSKPVSDISCDKKEAIIKVSAIKVVEKRNEGAQMVNHSKRREKISRTWSGRVACFPAAGL